MQSPDVLTRHDIMTALRGAGLGMEDKVVLHSSLSSMGWVDGGADAVVDAFLEVLGPGGLLMVPTFNYRMDGVFDRDAPTLTGRITEAVLARPEAVRSCCPTHSVTAIGEAAEQFCADHHLRQALGIDSPLDRVAQAGGFVMLLGVLHNTNTTVHIGEARAELPYVRVPFDDVTPHSFRVRLWDGTVTTVHYSEFPGCSGAFGALEGPMRLVNRIKDFRINRARVQLTTGMDIIETVKEMVAERPDWLLCNDPACRTCPRRRQVLREEGWM